MADQLDKASDNEERARQSAMVTSRKPEGPKPTGYCLYCGKALVALGGLPRRWCDSERSAEHEYEISRGIR